MKFFDCNLHLDQFKSPLSVIKEYLYFNIKNIVSLCDDIDSFTFLNQLLSLKKNVFLGIGLHPNKKYSEFEIRSILDLIKEKVDIIGECGLDFLRKINSIKVQFRYLIQQLKIAEKYDKIVILHVVNAEEEILEILNSFNLNFVIFHWYSGNIQYIEKILENGYYFSFNKCVINFKKYQKYISKIPINRLLLESDAPYKYKGSITKPEDFPKIIETIANIKLIDVDQVSKIIFNNSKSIFMNKYIKSNFENTKS